MPYGMGPAPGGAPQGFGGAWQPPGTTEDLYDPNWDAPAGWIWSEEFGHWILPADTGGAWYEGMGLEEIAAAYGVDLNNYSAMDEFLMDMIRLSQEGSQELLGFREEDLARALAWREEDIARYEAQRAEDEARWLAERAADQQRQWEFDVMTAQGQGLSQLGMAMPNYMPESVQSALYDWMQQLSTGYGPAWPGATEVGEAQLPPIEDFIDYLFGRGVPRWM